MVREAEDHRSEDAVARGDRRPQRARLGGLPGRAPARRAGRSGAGDEKARAEMLVADARQAIKDEAGLDRVQSLTSELQQVLQAAARRQAGGGRGPAASPATAAALESARTTRWSTRSSPGAEPHGQPGRASSTDEDRAAGDSPAPAVAPNLIRMPAAGRHRGPLSGAQSPTWTTSASGRPARWSRERRTERSRVAGAWLPVVDSVERAIGHAGDQSDAVVEGCGAFWARRCRA